MIINIEGTIGVGKSTLGEALSKELDMPYYPELASELTMKVLDVFYKDKARNSVIIQFNCLNNSFLSMTDAGLKGGGIIDRTIYGGRVFSDLLRARDEMTDIEYQVYLNVFNTFESLIPKSKLMVFLDCSLEESIRRTIKRDRTCERDIDMPYLTELHARYQDMYNNFNYTPKIKIDYDNYNIYDDRDKAKIVKIIKEAILTTG